MIHILNPDGTTTTENVNDLRDLLADNELLTQSLKDALRMREVLGLSNTTPVEKMRWRKDHVKTIYIDFIVGLL